MYFTNQHSPAHLPHQPNLKLAALFETSSNWIKTLEKVADLEGDLSTLTLEEIGIMTATDISAYTEDELAAFLGRRVLFY
jgi:hypothetical protein